jgi:hypothetical protein
VRGEGRAGWEEGEWEEKEHVILKPLKQGKQTEEPMEQFLPANSTLT